MAPDLTPALAPLIEHVSTDVTPAKTAARPSSREILAKLAPILARVRRDAHAVKGPNGVYCAKAPGTGGNVELTDALLLAHLDGSGPPIGAYLMQPGESTTRIALFDLDSHKGATSWLDMQTLAVRLCDAMAARGLKGHGLRSTGGRGVHLICLWADPQDAYSVRQLLAATLADLGLKPGAGSVAQGEVEVFPKQDSIPIGKWGNMFILPLAGQSVPLDPDLGMCPMFREDILGIEWKASDPVPAVEKPVRPPVVATGNLAEYRDALAATPVEVFGYSEWRDTVFALHFESGGSEEGFAVADEFSARFDTYDENQLRSYWDGADAGKQGGVTGASILFRARQAGWQDVTAESFEVVVSEPGELLRPNFKVDGKGRIEATIGNVEKALLRPDICGMELRYDEFRDEIVFGGDGAWQAFRDQHYTELRLCLEEDFGFKPVGREMIRDGVHHVAANAPIDTAIAWLGALKWDGVSRVDDFLARYFSVPASPYAAAVSRYWWTAMAGRVLSPGCQADMVPILISPEQGYRKSSSVAAMVPDGMHRQISFAQDATERARLLRGCLAAELAELHGLRTRELDEIKAWITRRIEEFVPKYKEFAVSVPRRCLFVGTTNSTELFDDPTGERRWLPVRVGVVDVEAIAADRDQLWAEASAICRASGVAWQEAERLAKAEHGAFRVLDTWEEDFVAWATTKTLDEIVPAERGFTTREVLVEGLGFAAKHVRKNENDRAVKALRKAGFVQKEYRRDGKKDRYWRLVSQVSHTET